MPRVLTRVHLALLRRRESKLHHDLMQAPDIRVPYLWARLMITRESIRLLEERNAD